MRAEPETLPPGLRPGESLPGEGEVHVWQIPLTAYDALTDGIGDVLSRDERERSMRFRSGGDAGRFIAAHSALRRILGAYTGTNPRDLEFLRGAFGKPRLAGGGEGPAGLRFNMADSGDVALVAVSSGREVGVDIERITIGTDLDAAAHRCFCGTEMRIFRQAAPEDREDTFFRFWSRKEAYIKARGEGLSLSLVEIDVSAAPAFVGGGWWLEDLRVDPEYRGAAVLEGRIHGIHYRKYSPRVAHAQA